ncbi:SIP domain-containing protein, partial [Isoptericola sp. NPDC060282]
ADAVRAAAGEFPAGAPHVFLHGEAGCVRDLRRWVRTQLGVPRELLSASGYWRRGSDDEGWRASKRDWAAAIERDDAELTDGAGLTDDAKLTDDAGLTDPARS